MKPHHVTPQTAFIVFRQFLEISQSRDVTPTSVCPIFCMRSKERWLRVPWGHERDGRIARVRQTLSMPGYRRKSLRSTSVAGTLKDQPAFLLLHTSAQLGISTLLRLASSSRDLYALAGIYKKQLSTIALISDLDKRCAKAAILAYILSGLAFSKPDSLDALSAISEAELLENASLVGSSYVLHYTFPTLQLSSTTPNSTINRNHSYKPHVSSIYSMYDIFRKQPVWEKLLPEQREEGYLRFFAFFVLRWNLRELGEEEEREVERLIEAVKRRLWPETERKGRAG